MDLAGASTSPSGSLPLWHSQVSDSVAYLLFVRHDAPGMYALDSRGGYVEAMLLIHGDSLFDAGKHSGGSNRHLK